MDTTTDLVLRRTATFVKEALSDPAHPKSCWSCLAGCIYLLLHPKEVFKGKVEPDFIFSKTCDIWPSILTFVTSPRTDAQLANLVISGNTCNCGGGWDVNLFRGYGISVLNSWNGMWKSEEPAIASSPFHCCFSYIFKQLIPYLHDVSPNDVAKRRTTVWPFSPQDCIPLGADVTIKSLHQWIHLYRDPSPFPISLIGVVTHISRSLVVDTLCNRRGLAGDIAKIGHQICDTTLQRIADLSLTTPQLHEIGDAFHRRMWHIEKFFIRATSEGKMTPLQLGVLLRGQERAWFDLCSKALDVLHTPGIFSLETQDELPSALNVFTEAAGVIYYVGGLLKEIPPTVPHMRSDIIATILLQGKEAGLDPNASVAFPVYNMLRAQKERTACFSIGCRLSIQMQDPGAPLSQRFARCSGCEVVSYCGRECQVSAWKDQTLPHKVICAKIKEVTRQGGGSVDADGEKKWRTRAKAGKINEETARSVMQWFAEWDAIQGSNLLAN